MRLAHSTRFCSYLWEGSVLEFAPGHDLRRVVALYAAVGQGGMVEAVAFSPHGLAAAEPSLGTAVSRDAVLGGARPRADAVPV